MRETKITHLDSHGDVLLTDIVIVLVSVQHYDSIGQGKSCIICHERRAIHLLQTRRTHNRQQTEIIRCSSQLFNNPTKFASLNTKEEQQTLSHTLLTLLILHWPQRMETHLQCHWLNLPLISFKTAISVCDQPKKRTLLGIVSRSHGSSRYFEKSNMSPLWSSVLCLPLRVFVCVISFHFYDLDGNARKQGLFVCVCVCLFVLLLLYGLTFALNQCVLLFEHILTIYSALLKNTTV